METNVLELKDVSKNFGGVKAVQNCSFEVQKGKITSLIGPNGAGKTTAFNIITGFVPPDQGSIKLNGKEIAGMKPHLIAENLSRTFQLPRVFDNLTIEENLLIALNNQTILKSMLHHRKANKEESKQIKKVLKEVGLDKDPQILTSELSYGQKRLVEIARALIKRHDVLMLDEPTAGVNPKLRQQLKQILKRLRKEGTTILLIEHDMEFVMDLSDEVIVMDAGKKLIADKPKKVREDPRVLEAYLGN